MALICYHFAACLVKNKNHSPSELGNQNTSTTKMVTQALVSSSIASSVEATRQILGGRPALSSTRRVSFVVRAASTPPVKVGLSLSLSLHSDSSMSELIV